MTVGTTILTHSTGGLFCKKYLILFDFRITDTLLWQVEILQKGMLKLFELLKRDHPEILLQDKPPYNKISQLCYAVRIVYMRKLSILIKTVLKIKNRSPNKMQWLSEIFSFIFIAFSKFSNPECIAGAVFRHFKDPKSNGISRSLQNKCTQDKRPPM